MRHDVARLHCTAQTQPQVTRRTTHVIDMRLQALYAYMSPLLVKPADFLSFSIHHAACSEPGGDLKDELPGLFVSRLLGHLHRLSLPLHHRVRRHQRPPALEWA